MSHEGKRSGVADAVFVTVPSADSVLATGSGVTNGSVAGCTGNAVVAVEASTAESAAWAAWGSEDEPRTASTTPTMTTTATAVRISQVTNAFMVLT